MKAEPNLLIPLYRKLLELLILEQVLAHRVKRNTTDKCFTNESISMLFL